MKLWSTDFEAGGAIPPRFTCDSDDISPALSWSHVPESTQSLALIVDDPDAPDPRAPKMTWVHWVLYNLPPTSTGLSRGVGRDGLPSGTREGKNDWKRTGYGGPCPPIGRHRYFFKLYALDAMVPDLREPTKTQLEEAMRDRIVAEAEIVGTYEKGERKSG